MTKKVSLDMVASARSSSRNMVNVGVGRKSRGKGRKKKGKRRGKEEGEGETHNKQKPLSFVSNKK